MAKKSASSNQDQIKQLSGEWKYSKDDEKVARRISRGWKKQDKNLEVASLATNNFSEYEITKQTYNNNPAYLKKIADLFDWSNQIDEFTKSLSGKNVLDAGCGAGRDTKEFLSHGFDVVGVDYSSEILKVVREIFPSAKFFEGSILKMDFLKDKSFDGVWACASVLHLKKIDLPKALSEFNRVLKENGKLFVSAKKGEGEEFVEDETGKRFFSYFTEDELKTFIEKADFKVTKVEVVQQKKVTGTGLTNWICVFAQKALE